MGGSKSASPNRGGVDIGTAGGALLQDLVNGLVDFTSRQNLFYSSRRSEGRRRDHLSRRVMLRNSTNEIFPNCLESFISFPISRLFLNSIANSIYQLS